jgi:hypothetical protein
VLLRVHDEPVRFLVDTAAPELVVFGCRLHGRLRELSSGYARRFVNGAGKELELKESRPTRIRLGATDLGRQEIFSTNDNADCGLPFDGVVGFSRLGLKWVAFDFEHQKFSWGR